MSSLETFITERNRSKQTITGDGIIDAKQYHLSLYRMYMVKLYDLCYIGDPTVYNEDEIKRVLIEAGVDKLNDIWGRALITAEHIGYLSDWYEHNEPDNIEACDVLSVLHGALKNREIWQEIDKLWEWSGITSLIKKRASITSELKGSRVYTKNAFKINEGILRCFYGFKSGYVRESFNELIYELVDKELEGRMQLVKGFTKEDHIRHLHIILSGDIKLDGEDAPKYEEWCRRQLDERGEAGYEDLGAYNWIRRIRSREVLKGIALKLESLQAEGVQVVAVDDEGLWVRCAEDTIYPVGQYVFICNEVERVLTNPVQRYYGYSRFYTEYIEEQLPDVNCVLGYTGQVYPVTYLEQNNLYYVGSPVRLYNEYGELCEYIDLEQTELVKTETVFKGAGATLNYSDDASKLSIKVKGKLSDMDKLLIKSYKEKDRGIFYTKIPAECGFTMAKVRKLCTRIIEVEDDEGIE